MTRQLAAMDSPLRDIFVGRTQEIGVLDQALAAASDGQGQLVLLAGEPGIGKSRTTDEVARRARRAGATVLVGRCYEDEGAPAFWPWIQVLRGFVRAHDATARGALVGADGRVLGQLCPELVATDATNAEVSEAPVVSDPAAARFRLFDAVTALLRRAAERTTVVLVLEDLHGADLPSLLLLQFLARESSQMRLLILGTLRDVALANGQPLASTLGELVRERHTTYVLLQGLTRNEVGEYMNLALAVAGPASALVDAVYERTEGNPLFVTQVTSMLATRAPGVDDTLTLSRVVIPTAVQAAIGNRLAELSPPSRALLERAAIFGRAFRRDALAQMADDEAATLLAALDEALAIRVLEEFPERPGWLRFTHVLIRDVLYGQIASSQRLTLHGRAAAGLLAVTGPDADPPLAELARHFAAADDPQAVEFARRAGDRATDLLAYEEAVKQYRFALDAVDRLRPMDDPERCELLLALGEAQRRSGDITAAKETILRAAVSARRRSDREQLSRAALAFGAEFSWGEGAVVDEVQVGLLEEAAAAWGDTEAPLHARLLGRLGAALYFLDVPARRAALCERAVAMARRLGDHQVLLFTLDALHTGTWGMANQEARLAVADEMLRLIGPADDPRLRFRAHLWRASDALELQDLAALDVAIDACRRIAESFEEPILQFYAAALEFNRVTLAGRLAESDERLMRFAQVAERAGIGATIPIIQFSLLYLRGALGDSVPFLELATTLNPGAPGLRCMLSQAYIEATDAIGAARELATLSAHEFRTVPRDGNALLALTQAAASAARLRDRTSAAVLYELLLPGATRGVTIVPAAGYLGSTAYYLGMLAGALERWAEAEEHFERALSDHARMGASPWVAACECEYGAMLLTRGQSSDRARALGLLARASTTAETLGLGGIARRARAVLEDGGGTAAAGDGAGADGQCRLEGDTWAITYHGTTIRLRDARGMRYLAQLLRHPNHEFHASELVAVVDANGNGVSTEGLRIAAGLGDAGPKLDYRAQGAYRTRLLDLREMLAEAERDHDLGTAARVRAEIDALESELVGAARGKRSASHGERARIAVTKGLKIALEKIAAAHPELGAHLRVAIRRGYFCSYVPDPRRPITWYA